MEQALLLKHEILNADKYATFRGLWSEILK